MIKEKMPITWGLPSGTRSEVLDYEMLSLLRKAGLNDIDYPPESGSKKILEVMKKQISEDFVSILFSKMKKNDLETISETLNEQLSSDGLKIRISKQKLIMGKIILENKDAIKITITIPVYVKKNLAKIYRQTLKIPE